MNLDGGSVPRLARPGAPVTARADKVPVRGLCLLDRALAVTEEAALARAHLEQPEVLAVLRRRLDTGLAARDLERLSAVGAERVADRLLGRALEVGEESLALRVGFAPGERGAGTVGLRLRRRECAAGDPEPEGRLLFEPGVAEEPSVLLEEADDGARLLQRLDVLCQLRAEVGRRAGPGRRRCGAENQGTQTRD